MSNEKDIQTLLQRGAQIIEKERRISLGSEETQKRIREEAGPVLSTLQGIMNETAQFIVTGKGDYAQLVKKFVDAFGTRNCPIQFSTDERIIHPSNPARLVVIEESRQISLVVAESFKDVQTTKAKRDFLLELLHELAALLLCTQIAKKENIDIYTRDGLRKTKQKLELNEHAGLSHVVDAVELSMIDSYKE